MKKSIVSTVLPQMGDNVSLASTIAGGIGGLGLIGAGLARKKKLKNDVADEEIIDDSFEPTYDDLESVAEQWSKNEERKTMYDENQAKTYDYDELENIAEQWKNSKEREEWLQHRESKGKTR